MSLFCQTVEILPQRQTFYNRFHKKIASKLLEAIFVYCVLPKLFLEEMNRHGDIRSGVISNFPFNGEEARITDIFQRF